MVHSGNGTHSMPVVRCKNITTSPTTSLFSITHLAHLPLVHSAFKSFSLVKCPFDLHNPTHPFLPSLCLGGGGRPKPVKAVKKN